MIDGVRDPAAGVVVEGDLPVGLLPRLDAVPGVAGHAARIRGSVQLRGGYLDVTADPGAGPLAVLTGDEDHAREVQGALDGARNVLLVVSVFVLIAVVAAVLVAISTFRIVFAQRMRQLALLRAIGAGRGSITRALGVEGVVTGLVTGGAGVRAALVLGQLASPIAAAFDVTISGPGFPVGEGLAVIAMAVVLTLVAVLSPARSAAKVAPLEALRAAGVAGAQKGIGVGRWILGGLLVLGSAGLAALVFALLPTPQTQHYDPFGPLFATVGSASLAFFALAVLGPVLVRPFLAVVGWPLRRLGPLGRLAVGGVGGAPRRAAAVSVVVALGVSLIGGTLVAGASLRTVLERQVAVEAPADFQVLAEDGMLPATVVNAAKQRTELTDVTFFRSASELTVNGQDASFDAADIDPAALPRLADVDPVGPGEIAVARWAAGYLQVREGDRITVRRQDRTAEVTVTALLDPSAPLGLSALMNPADLTKLGVPAAPSRMVANAATSGETGRTAGATALRETLSAAPGLGTDVMADRIDELDKVFTLVLAAGIALIGLTVLVAVVGVGSTSALSVVERTRESGLLRAVGLSQGGLRLMLTAESSLYGVIGAGFGLLIGVPYAWLAVRTMDLGAPLELPVGRLAAVFLALVLFTALAGVLPARRAAKVSPVAALAID